MTDWRVCHVCKSRVDVLTEQVFDHSFYYYLCETCDEIYAKTQYNEWVESGCVMEWYTKGNKPDIWKKFISWLF